MKAKIILSIALCTSLVKMTQAQTDVDASRYSGESVTGTARYSAMAGAFGALGGDFTTLSHNPAGIAIYRTSEFTFTPSIYFNSSSSTFINNKVDANKSNFNIANVGLVYTNILSKDATSEGWKSWNFGFGYNRMDNFHFRNAYEGLNPGSSLTDHFAENANGTNYDQLDGFYEYLAYATYLINPDSSNQYSSAVSGGNVFQRRTEESKGAIGETVISFGGNYSNKLYIGATLGIKSLRYVYYSVYEERDDNQADSLHNFTFNEDLTTRGSGIDFKLGLIYKPTDALRIGLAIHSPTWYSMHDDYINKMSSKFDGGFSESVESPFGQYDYDYTAPFNFIGSLAFIFGKSGLIGADYQYTDYSTANFSGPGASFSEVNNLISNKYTGVHTLRLGGEYIIDQVSLRAGFAMSTSPLNAAYQAGSSDFSKKVISGGIGFRPGRMFLDLGYVYTLNDQFYQPYTLLHSDVPGVKSRVISGNILATIGFKF